MRSPGLGPRLPDSSAVTRCCWVSTVIIWLNKKGSCSQSRWWESEEPSEETHQDPCLHWAINMQPFQGKLCDLYNANTDCPTAWESLRVNRCIPSYPPKKTGVNRASPSQKLSFCWLPCEIHQPDIRHHKVIPIALLWNHPITQPPRLPAGTSRRKIALQREYLGSFISNHGGKNSKINKTVLKLGAFPPIPPGVHLSWAYLFLRKLFLLFF